MKLRIEVLGQFRVTVNGTVIPAEAWRRERGAALVKLLALTSGHRVHREKAMDLFWPELDRDAAGANLRKAVMFARKSLGEPELLELSNEIVALGGEVELDSELFEAAAKLALRDPTQCEAAADLYGGELLPDDRYVEWVEAPRAQLRERYARVLRAGKLWDRLIALDPTDEQAQVSQMQAALDAGNRSEVIRQFQQLRERLRVDLGMGPSKAAVSLYEQALAVPALEPPSLTDRLRASVAWGLSHLHGGDFTRAESVAREARALALDAGLGREVGEATALLGMVAHMQGRWRDLFQHEFIAGVRNTPNFAANIFDGHLCLAEFCLDGASGHEAIGSHARELRTVAEQAGSSAGRAMAQLILGKAELFSGRLDEAEQLLIDAETLYGQTESIAGRVIALQCQAEIALSRGQKWRANRLIQRALGMVDQTWLRAHFVTRLQSLSLRAAANEDDALRSVREGDRTLAGKDTCQPCSMSFRAASAIALAEAGELEQVDRRLDEAERLAGMWSGGPWQAALWEARGVLRRAQGKEDRAQAAFLEAAARFGDLHRLLDQARCEQRMRA
jgi:DNA-binding SARP family transcriptional activator